jgi:protease-4
MAFAGDGDEEEAAPDAFSRLAARPRLAVLGAVGEAERLLSGAAIQTRCLECAGQSAARPRIESGGLAAWLVRLLGA